MEKVSKRIEAFNKRLLPHMVQIKYHHMAESLYRFYRGTNHLFCEDFKNANPAIHSPNAWITGDLHLENFGSFKSDNRLVYFDLNDFDEAVLGPACIDIARMVTSIFIAFDTLNIEQKKALNMAQLFLKSYSSVLQKGKPNYIEPRTAKGIVCDFLTIVSTRKAKDLLKKKTVIKKNKVQALLIDDRHLKLSNSLKKQLKSHITNWLKIDHRSPYNYKVKDIAFRVAGTGSLGQKRYIILLKSSNAIGEKYLLLDMKESLPSSVLPYIQTKQPKWPSEAERIISIQYRMQNRAPALLSSTIFNGTSYVIEEMQPTEDSINFKLIRKEYRNIYQVIDDMAMLTASAHLRSSGHQGSSLTDDFISFGSKTDWHNPLLQYAIRYSAQVKTDYFQFITDYKKGAFKIRKISK